MVRLIAALAAGTALAGCAARTVPPAEVPTPVAEVVPVPVAPAPKAQIGTFGFDAAGMNPSVKPGEIFLIANGTGQKPDSRDKRTTVLSRARRPQSKRTRELLDAAKATPTARSARLLAFSMTPQLRQGPGADPALAWQMQPKNAAAMRRSREAARNARRLLRAGRPDYRHSVLISSGLSQLVSHADRDLYLLTSPIWSPARRLSRSSARCWLAGEP